MKKGKKKKKAKKLCIYLDQFAVSDMVDSNTSYLWTEIRIELERLHNEGKIFCPKSAEHYIETSKKSLENSRIHDLFLEQISDGYCLRIELFITSQLISSLIRKNNITLKTYMAEGVKNVFENEDAYKHFNEVNDRHFKLFSDVTSDLNSFRKVVKNDGLEPDIKESMMNVLGRKEEMEFATRLNKLNQEGQMVIRGDQIADEEVANWIDLIIHQLLTRHKFTRKEMVKLEEEINRNGFKNIPTLHIKYSMFHLASIYAKKETPSDHIDFSRIAAALPISDYLFTDKKRKAELVELKFPERYKTKVYSGTENDLNSFLSELKILEL